MRGVRPNDAALWVPRAVRVAAVEALLVAALLSIVPIPALLDEPGAKGLGSPVLAHLSKPPVWTAEPEAQLNAVPDATVVAPFDSKFACAGPFRDFGRVLIIRHDRRYYSVLAGLRRIDLKIGDAVLAGEPVGAVPAIPSFRSGAEAQESDESDPSRL